MFVAFASGKGGTGKTLISTNLARHFASTGFGVSYVDTDVEAPNGHLFLKPVEVNEKRFTVTVPVLKAASCSGCGACQRACHFNAIIALNDRVMVLPELCHACGACILACEESVLGEKMREIGAIRRGKSGPLDFWSGVLDIGEAKASPLIHGLLQEVVTAHQDPNQLVILDAPPGTSCSAMAVVRAAELVVLVTEPTPFGHHDLNLAVQMCRALEKPIAAVINRSDLGDEEVYAYLERQSIPVLEKIPYSKELAHSYAVGELVVDSLPPQREIWARLAHALTTRSS